MIGALEKWRPVVGHEGGYEVSDCGRVRSIERTIKKRRGRGASADLTYICRQKSVIRATYVNSLGYHNIKLGKRGTVHVHALVLEAFVGPRPKGHEACHRDGNPSNNTLPNLRWGTRRDNADDRRKHGRNCVGEKQGRSKLTWHAVRQIRTLVASLSDSEIARRYGVTRTNVRRIRRYETWQEAGALK